MSKSPKAAQPAVQLYDGTGSRLMSLPNAPQAIALVELRASEQDEFEAIPASDWSLRRGQLVFIENPSGIFTAWPKGKVTVRVTG